MRLAHSGRARLEPKSWTSQLGWLRSFNELRDYGDFDPVSGLARAAGGAATHDHSTHDHGAAGPADGELTRTLQAAGLDPNARGGFPRRTSPLVNARTAARMSQSPGGRDVRVYGTVGASGGTLVHGATPTDAVADATGPAGALSLVARRADGSMVSSVPAKLDAVHVHGGGQLVTFTGQLPAADAAGVEVYNGDQKISELLRSPTVPSVTVTAPRRGSVSGRRRTTRIAWRTTDPDGGNLLAKIEYSLNGGRGFGTLATKPTKNGADAIALPSARLAASRNARIRVRVNDGFNQGADSSRRFRARGAPPQVVITSPARGGRFPPRTAWCPWRVTQPPTAASACRPASSRGSPASGGWEAGRCGRCSSPRGGPPAHHAARPRPPRARQTGGRFGSGSARYQPSSSCWTSRPAFRLASASCDFGSPPPCRLAFGRVNAASGSAAERAGSRSAFRGAMLPSSASSSLRQAASARASPSWCHA